MLLQRKAKLISTSRKKQSRQSQRIWREKIEEASCFSKERSLKFCKTKSWRAFGSKSLLLLGIKMNFLTLLPKQKSSMKLLKEKATTCMGFLHLNLTKKWFWLHSNFKKVETVDILVTTTNLLISEKIGGNPFSMTQMITKLLSMKATGETVFSKVRVG